MAKRNTTPRDQAPGANPTKVMYKGHEIFDPKDERRKKIFIDGRPVKWGETGGTYYLDVYAYDRGKTLDETVKRYLDSLQKATPRKEVK